jgi:hypothetical protein
MSPRTSLRPRTQFASTNTKRRRNAENERFIVESGVSSASIHQVLDHIATFAFKPGKASRLLCLNYASSDNPSKISKRYKAFQKKVHPDQVGRKHPDLKEKAKEASQAVVDAYAKLGGK